MREGALMSHGLVSVAMSSCGNYVSVYTVVDKNRGPKYRPKIGGLSL